MAKIFIAVPEHKPWAEFEESLSRFIPLVSSKHDVEVYKTRGKSLVDAQNEIADEFLKSDKDYLLFLEEDHWGHTLEMLESLIKADTEVCAINYYSRHPGRMSCLLQYTGKSDPKKKYIELYEQTSYQECDLVPFGMTLIKREVFDKLDKPYFRVNDYYGEMLQDKDINARATDRDFCDRLIEAGIRPMGCFDHTLIHSGIDEHNYIEYRKQDILDNMRNIEKITIEEGFRMLRKRQSERAGALCQN